MATLWVGLDRGDADQPHLEQRVLGVLEAFPAPATHVCTLLVREGHAHHAASLALDLGTAAGGALGSAASLTRVAERFGGALVALGAAGEPALELGEEALRPGARVAAAALRDGAGGRAIRFPGQEALVGRVRVGDVPSLSAIASLTAIGTSLSEDRILDTRDHVRPAFADGALRLMVVPAAGGTVIPHDRPRAHECGACGH